MTVVANVKGYINSDNWGVYEEIHHITTPGIYENEELGLISISSDGQNRTTIANKNLGATTVFNYGDTLTDANCGYFYQWGNNYGFPHSGAVTTSSTPVDASAYGPGNYYNSSTFIAASGIGNRSLEMNDNLWGGVTGTNEAMQGPAPDGFHVPSSDELVAVCEILTTTFSMSANDETMGTYLKMPMAGFRNDDDAEASEIGGYGNYWTSTAEDSYGAYYLIFSESDFVPQDVNYRDYGYSVRPFKNEAVQPDTSRTKLY